MPAEDAPRETQSKNKRKKKAQNKKQLEGGLGLFSLLFTFHLFLNLNVIISLSVFTENVDESWEYGLRDALFTACKVGDVDTLCRLLELPVKNSEGPEGTENKLSDAPSPLTLLNKPIDSSGFTLLHVASAAAQKAVVKLLLDAGADPACRYGELIVLVTLLRVKF